MNKRILLVDDEPNILEGYQRQLRKKFEVDTAVGGPEALKRITKSEPYALVVADMQMPQMNGVEFLSIVLSLTPDTVRIMLTGNADQETAMNAINEGHIFRFLTKPCSPETLTKTLEAGLEQYRLITAEAELLEKTLIGSVNIMTDIMYMTEPRLFGRAKKLRDYIQEVIGLVDYRNKWELELAALLSQIGHLTVPTDITLKVVHGLALTEQEKSILANIPEVSSHLLSKIPRLEKVAQIIRYQNKNYNGSGVPQDALSGESIPLGSRILKIVADLLELEEKGTARSVALRLMNSRHGCYDPHLLETVTSHSLLPLNLPSAEMPAGRSARTLRVEELKKLQELPSQNQYSLAVSFEELHVGDILVADMHISDGSLLLPAGTKITEAVLERLKNYKRLNTIVEPIHVTVNGSSQTRRRQ